MFFIVVLLVTSSLQAMELVVQEETACKNLNEAIEQK